MKSSIATVTLSGKLQDKLHAAANAGYAGVEIFENDLVQSELSPRDIGQLASDLGLEIVALQPLRNFEGLPEDLRRHKFFEARSKFEWMHELGTGLLLVCSNVLDAATDDPGQIRADFADLADLARAEGLAVGFEALAWGRYIHDYQQAWDVVKSVDHPALGLVLDTFHIFARDLKLETLVNDIPAEKIALVQTADAPDLRMESLYFSRHYRCFPGQGVMPTLRFTQCVKDKGYSGYWSHEIFNDDFRASPPEAKAVDGMRSLVWLDENTAQGSARVSAPPEISRVEFIEFAIDDNEGAELVDLLQRLGFRETHRHRTKNVSLMRQGGINLVLNREEKSLAHDHLIAHGASVCALGLATTDTRAMVDRARRYGCERFDNQAGPGELNIPAVRGVGDSLVYLLDSNTRYHFYDIDFVPIDEAPATGIGLDDIDHIGQAVPKEDFLSATLLYKAVFDMDIRQNRDLSDIFGLVVSRVASNRTGRVQIPINMALGREASPERFVVHSLGSGFQQLAFCCADIFTAAESVPPEYVLPIPDNYYRDLQIRFELSAAFTEKLQRLNILYDKDEKGGEFFHFYTQERQGVFLEILQRDDYHGFGEANANVRLAAQARLYEREKERQKVLMSLY